MKKIFILMLALGATFTSCRKDWISPDDLAEIEAGYNAQITALTADLAAATTEVDALEGTITTLETTIANLEAEAGADAATIAALQAEVQAELVKVAQLEAEVEALELALATAGTDADELADQIEVLEADIEDLQAEVAALTEEALVKDALIAELEATVTELTADLDSVFDLFESTTASTTVEEIVTQIEALQDLAVSNAASITTLEEAVALLEGQKKLTTEAAGDLQAGVAQVFAAFAAAEAGEFGGNVLYEAFYATFDATAVLALADKEELTTVQQLLVINWGFELVTEYAEWVTGKLAEVLTVTIDGTTYTYLELDGEEGLSEGDFIITTQD